MKPVDRFPPPPVINGFRVLEYAILDERVSFSGYSHHYVDETELGPVPCLAICQELETGEIYLCHCDLNWTVLGSGSHSSVDDGKGRAERIYRGSARCWVEAPAIDADVLNKILEESAQPQCIFCGKSGPPEVWRLIEIDGKFICDSCVKKLWHILNEE